MEHQGKHWVNYEEAMGRVRQIDDASLEQFVMRALTVVLQRFQAGKVPEEKLDLLYFVEAMTELYQQKENLVRVLSGEDLRWYGDTK